MLQNSFGMMIMIDEDRVLELRAHDPSIKVKNEASQLGKRECLWKFKTGPTGPFPKVSQDLHQRAEADMVLRMPAPKKPIPGSSFIY